MAETLSTMLPLGTGAPDFALPDTEGNIIKLSDFAGNQALLVIFMCNHCPFVKHILPELVNLAQGFQQRGVAVVGINSNDVENHPDDHPEKMAQLVQKMGISFPYLYDETQQVARAYQAACTPDFFLFDKNRQLVYRGQMDDSRPGNNLPVTGRDLQTAIDALLEGRPIPQEQKPSIGCNIKWKQP